MSRPTVNLTDDELMVIELGEWAYLNLVVQEDSPNPKHLASHLQAMVWAFS